MQDPSSLSFQGIKPQFPEQEQHLKCPRCESTNTKFCYYNNYNLSQPRHFCKSCRRYWTKGGALRNIPVGGGTRKNSKRSGESTAKENSNCKRSAPSPSVPKVENLQAFDVGNGSFSSLLGDGVGLGGFIGGGGGVQGGENGGNSGSGGGESFLDGSGGWPDLSIYTPGSNFPCD